MTARLSSRYAATREARDRPIGAGEPHPLCERLLLLVAAIAGSLLVSVAGASGAGVEPPRSLAVLFVSASAEPEQAITDHLAELGVFQVTAVRQDEVHGGTDLSPFDLIVLTGFSPSLSDEALRSIEESGTPVLIVEFGEFAYSHRLGLVSTPQARPAELDALDALAPGLNVFTRFAGFSLRVGEPRAEVLAVQPDALLPGVIPLYGTGDGFGEVAVLIDPQRRIAATGLFDTPRYTAAGWRLFDLLLDQLQPLGPRWQDGHQVVQAYLQSGLRELLDGIEGQMLENADSWSAEDVSEATWRTMLTWNLFELADLLSSKLEMIFPANPLLSGLVCPTGIPHPKSTKTPTDDSLWMIGQDTSPKPTVPYWGGVIQGTDLGISVEHYGKTLFYMGDTDPRMGAQADNCDPAAVCNDAILALSPCDKDPSDGVDVIPYTQLWWSTSTAPGLVPSASWSYYPQSIPGVHTKVWDKKFWKQYVDKTSGLTVTWDPIFTVPANAISTDLPYPDPFKLGSVSIPTIVLFYGTAFVPEKVDFKDPIQTPRTWAACSFDGLEFWNCYGTGQPFGEEKPADPARLLQVIPVEITATELTQMCGATGIVGYAPTSPLCDSKIYDPVAPEDGLLLFGSGKYWSGLYVGYVRNVDFGKLHKTTGLPVVSYFAKSFTGKPGWSDKNGDASYILPSTPNLILDICDGFLGKLDCIVWYFAMYGKTKVDESKLPAATDLFNITSIEKVKSGVGKGKPPYLIMISSHVTDPTLYFRYASLSRFWEWSSPKPLDAVGYGPHIIDPYTTYGAGGNGTLDLWFVTSKWDGKFPTTNYGVYTDHEAISPWPPVGRP